MISKDEIESRSEEFDIHTSNVQRDYIFGWLLAGIYGHSSLGESLILKGGNCLRKAYFEKTRYSADLDFSITNRLTDDFIKNELDKVCDFISDNCGIIFHKDRNLVRQTLVIDRDRTVHEARLYFSDFYGNESNIIIKVKLDIVQFDRIYLPTQTRNIIHPYSDHNLCQAEMICVKLEEILASKLKCLLQRQQSGDLYDFVHSIMFAYRDVEVSKREIASTLLRMTIFERNPGALRGLLLDLPKNIFKSLWSKYLVCPKLSRVDFEKAMDNFSTTIKELFEGHENYRTDYTFFPSELRNPILSAGSNQKLLELTYGGISRIVEPYSLSFKKKNNGMAREYFYGFDRTGGNSSGPGIKAFLPDKIEMIKNLEEEFEPRYEIELSKSVEPSSIGYFSSGGAFRRSSSRTRIRSTSERKFTIQCPICDKKFTRKTRSTKLNPHKDTYGNKCYGRRGVLIDFW